MSKLTLMSIAAIVLVCLMVASAEAGILERLDDPTIPVQKPTDEQECAGLTGRFWRFEDFCLRSRNVVFNNMGNFMYGDDVSKKVRDVMREIMDMFEKTKAEEGAKFPELANIRFGDVKCLTSIKFLNMAGLFGY